MQTLPSKYEVGQEFRILRQEFSPCHSLQSYWVVHIVTYLLWGKSRPNSKPDKGHMNSIIILRFIKHNLS